MSDEPRNPNRKHTNPAVIAISVLLMIALVSVLHHAFIRARQDAQRTACMSNLKSIGIDINMYMQDHNNQLPSVSGFGPELDKHTELWGTKGDIFNKKGSKPKYFSELILPYIRNVKIALCPSTYDQIWILPDGGVDLGNCSYIFNAWCIADSTKTPPVGCIEIAGMNAEKCQDIANAPIVWDAISGYSQAAHADSINVVYMDFHAKSVDIDPNKPPYNTASGSEGHFWGAPDPNKPNGTLGAVGWQ